MTRAETAVEIHELIAERRSPRSLDESAVISDVDLIGILEAARWAPSANNLQPWKLVIVILKSCFHFLRLRIKDGHTVPLH
jgi:nitroreductase